MDIFVRIVFGLGALLSAARCADILLWTDAVSGLCVFGSVWWRYAAAAAAVLLSIACGYTRPSRPRAMCGRHPAAGVLSVLGAVCFAAACAVRIAAVAVQMAVGYLDIATFVRAALEALCAVWLACLGRAWLRRGEWKAPAGGLVLAVFGSAIFYWRVLARFIENSSSWHRVAETAEVWVLLAALIFLSALARALYLPGTAKGEVFLSGALAAFCLCLCWQLPQLAVTYSFQDVFSSLGLCCIGALGAVCAAACSGRPEGRHASIG